MNEVNANSQNKDQLDNDDIIIEDDLPKYKPGNEKEKMTPNKGIKDINAVNDNNNAGNKNIHGLEIEQPNNVGDVTDPNIKVTTPFKSRVPPNLLKTFIVTVVLAGIGVVLIILGCIQSIAKHTPGEGIMFWVLGSIVIIPGGFYTYQFFKAYRSHDDFEREKIFDQIPEL